MWISNYVADAILLATVRLTIAVVLGVSILACLRTNAAKLHRWMWSAILIQSLLLAPLAIPLPVLDPVPSFNTATTIPIPTPIRGSDDTTTIAATTDQAATPQSWNSAQIVAGVWLLGFTWILFLFVLSQVVVQWGLRRAIPARRAWQDQLRRTARAAAVKQHVDLLVSADWGPLLTRSWRGYCVIVPRESWQFLSHQQRESILMHELAHLRRGDLWSSLLMRLGAAFHWFNPLAWWVVARFDEAAEWACDDEVRNRSDLHAASLAGALLSFTGPKPLIRFGVSSARGARLSVRVRRLVEPSIPKESKMKKFVIAAAACVLVGTGLLRLDLVARDMQDEVSNATNQEIPILQLAQRLASSEDPLQKRLAVAMKSKSGQLVLSDHLRNDLRAAATRDRDDVIDQVLRDHFKIDAKSAEWIDPTDPLRGAIVNAAKQSDEDMRQLTVACESLSERLIGDDETTRLVKRFLSEEAGPAMLYIKEFRSQMRPSNEMLMKTFGKVLAADAFGQLRVRPDAREDLRPIVALREAALERCERLAKQIKIWADQLCDADELHRRLKLDASEPLFAARFVSEAIFGKQDLGQVSVNRVMDQLDEAVVDTARGLCLSDKARPDVEQVLNKYEQIRETAQALRESLSAFRERLADDDADTRELKLLMQTDLALVAVAMEAENVNLPIDQLLRGLLADLLVESDAGLSVRQDAAESDKINENIQAAMREFRQTRRRAAPLRELAEKIADKELAAAIDSIGGMLVIRQQVILKIANLQQQEFQRWQDSLFTKTDQGLVIRSDARVRVEELLAAIDRVEKELENNDF